MRKLLILLLIPFSVALNAQQIVDYDKIWVYGNYPIFGGSPYSHALSFQSEFIIDGKTYLQLHRTTDTSFVTGWEPQGVFMREDSLGRVYLRNNDHDLDELLYDFNIPIADTTTLITVFNDTCSMTSVAKDSVVLLDGLERKRIQFDDIIGNSFRNLNWVEGIGSMSHLTDFKIFCFPKLESSFRCFIENGTTVYNSFQDGPCYITSSIDNKSEFQNTLVYPNPAQNLIRIKTSYLWHTISIKSLDGETLLTSGYAQEIDVQTLSSGIYLLLLESEKNFLTKKIVIQ